MTEKKKILVFDAQDTGHHLQYLNYINSYASVVTTQVILVVTAKAAKRINAPVNVSEVIVIDSQVLVSNSFWRSVKVCRYLARLSKDRGVKTVIFINLNPYILTLHWPWVKWSGISVSGINYSPPHRIVANDRLGWRSQVALGVKKCRKYIQFFLLACLPNISKVFILDDKEGAAQLNRQLKSAKFTYLPDPIESESRPPNREEMLLNFSLPKDQRIALQFGAIGPRKNTKVCVQTFLSRVNPGVHLLVVGKGDPTYIKELKALVTQQVNGVERVTIQDEFVDDKELELLFGSCDFVLLAYKDFYGSSGVLGHAAKYKKPVIASNQGLIAHLVQKYRLGILVEPSVEGVANGVEQLLREKTYSGLTRAYLSAKTMDLFGAILLDC